MVALDAIVLATEPSSRVRIAGLTATERARRVAGRVGAERVLVVEKPEQLGEIATWRGGSSRPLLVVRANQLVHTPLVAPLIEALPRDGVAVAVVPPEPAVGDLTAGDYAGAFVAVGNAADEVAAALATADDRTVVAMFPEAVRVPHGAIARAPIDTREQRKAAHALLYKILVKAQDNEITRYLYRPVSLPLTKLLVWTPITPNQISYAVGVMCAIGIYFTAQKSFNAALLGTFIMLVASYVDCCDGEVARVKLLSSKFGAWVDTVVDEVSSLGYMLAIGWHCHLQFTDWLPWKPAIVIGGIAMAWCIYCIYYNIIVAVGSANSQDYVGRFEVVPGTQPNSVRLAPAAAKAIAPKAPLPRPIEVLLTYLPYLVRKDFISWMALILAAMRLTYVVFGMYFVGAIITFVVVTVDHIRLRKLRRSIARTGMLLEAP